MNRRMQALIASVLVAALALAGAWAYWQRNSNSEEGHPVPPGPAGEVALVPLENTPSGVEATSAFRLTSQRSLNLAQVQKALTVQPAVDLRVEPVGASGREFRVMPSRSLDAGRVYRFRLASAAGAGRTYQWSFQTRAQFRIIGTLPRNQGQGVPLNTGIEIAFSHEDWPDLEPFFAISPAVAGRFERHKKTAVFVPKEPLQEGTVYTVTLKKGISQTSGPGSLNEDYTFAFETVSKGDNGGGKAYFGVPDLQEFPPGTAPYFGISYYGQGKQSPPPVDVTVYQFKDAAAFMVSLGKAEKVPYWASGARNKYRVETAGLQKVASFQSQAKQFPNMYSPYLVFPEAVEPGYYLAVFAVEGMTRESHFQVSSLSSYVAVTTTQTLVWFNDLTSKLPVAGVKVKPVSGPEAVSGQDGVAVLPSPDATGASGLFLHARAPNGNEAVVPSPGGSYYYWGQQREKAGLYWKYLYVDRPLYKPEDKVNVWGVVRPREPGAKPVSEVTVEVVRNEYRGGYDDRPVPLVKSTVPVADSTFTGSVALPSLRPGSYQLVVRMGEEYLTEHWFEVQTYSKPAYQLEVVPSRRAIFANETMEMALKAAFFEGTPVPNLRLSYNFNWGKDGARQVTTDASGRATVRFTPSENGYRGYGGPSTAWFTASAELPETGQISAQATVMVFTSNITVAPKVDVEQGQATIRGDVNQITLEKINAGESPWDYKGGPAGGRPVKGVLVEQNWVREDAGEYYDFISKTVHKAYRYRQENKEAATFTATTDSAGRFSHTLPVNPEKSYEVKLEVQDTAGTWTPSSLYFSGKRYAGYEDSFYRYYHLDSGNQWQWGLGEEATLVFKSNSLTTPDRSQGYLFYSSRRGLQSYKVQDSGTFRYALREADLPGTTIRAVYFDGRLYREARDEQIRFNPKERQLQVTITPDKPEYRPGDTVGLAIRVSDKNGKPVKAQVNLNLVDEALFALQEQNVNLLTTLYGEYIPSGVLRTRASHFVPEPGGGAEKGGDGGGARKEFQDAIFFHTVQTDAKGLATASFKVPDNLTSWRLTWHALATGSMEAANGSAGIPVRLPFFVEMVLGESYLAGDRPEPLLRSYGTALKEGDLVSYKLRVTAPDGTVKEQILQGKAFEPVKLGLPEVGPGTYTLRVDGSAPGGRTDAVELKFSVAESYLRQEKVTYHLLSPGLTVKGAEKGITTLTFTDYERSRYLRLLEQLRWQWGNRMEQKLARSLAVALLEEHFGLKSYGEAPAVNTHSYQTQQGSIAILPYSDGELKLSVLAADLAANRFDRGALQQYFEKVLADTGAGREQQILALWGLAALDEPVLLQVQALLQATDLNLPEQFYLALAVAKLGDLEGARPLFYSLMARYGEQVGSAVRIKEGRDQDEILSYTALAGVLAAKLGEPHAPALAEYLADNRAKDVLLLLEEALMVQEGLPQLSGAPVSFTYSLDGKTESKELKPGQAFRLPVTAKGLADLKFQEVKGKVGLAVQYEAPVAAAELKQQDGFKLSRSYQVNGRATTEFKPGDIVRVTLSYTIPNTAPGGGYEVSDYLPSGMKLIERPWQYGVKPEKNWWQSWPLEINGQKATFYAYGQSDTIFYYARVTAPGSYWAEQPVLQHQKSGLTYSYGPRIQVKIGWQ